jgi:hypothetical protein
VARSAHLLLHVGTVLDVLVEVADVAPDLLVWLEREGDNGYEAEGEPFPVQADELVCVLCVCVCVCVCVCEAWRLEAGRGWSVRRCSAGIWVDG